MFSRLEIQIWGTIYTPSLEIRYAPDTVTPVPIFLGIAEPGKVNTRVYMLKYPSNMLNAMTCIILSSVATSRSFYSVCTFYYQ